MASPKSRRNRSLRVFLTGAAGFVGARVAAQLAEEGHAVICAVRQTDHGRLAALGDRVSVARLDLQDGAAVQDAMAQHRPDAVCHAAWQGVAGGARNDDWQDVNVAVSANLAQAALANGVRVIVGIGSQAEYGPINRMAVESDPCRPTTRYGRAKCQAHDAMAAACAQAGARFAWMRIFSLYGPGDNPGWLIPSVTTALLQGQRPALTGGEQNWDFLHVQDAARAIAAVLRAPAAAGLFNLGSGQAPPLRHTLEMLRDLIDPALPLGFGDVAYRPDQVMHLQADVSRLRRVTGWAPQVGLQEGLAQTVAWHRARLSAGAV